VLERQNETDAVDCCHHLDTFGHKRLRLLLRGRDVTDGFIDRAASVAPSREVYNYKRTSAEVVRSLGHVLKTDSRCSLCRVYFLLLDIYCEIYNTATKSYYSAIVTNHIAYNVQNVLNLQHRNKICYQKVPTPEYRI